MKNSTAKLEQASIGWKQPDPPKDGRTIIAIGRILGEDDIGASSNPFLGAIRWQKTESGYEGWMLNGLALACNLDDEVIIDFWIEHPFRS